MLNTPEAVIEALRENHDRPHGPQRTVTAEELVEAAGQFEKPDVLVTALLELMSAYEYTGEYRKSPVVFGRLLTLWDESPEEFSEWEAHQVYWRFKWVATSLLDVPEVSLASVRGWIDETQRRYEKAGHGMQPVAAMRYQVAAHTGAGVADAYDLWVTRPRTELSDCEACETRHLAAHQMDGCDDPGALDTLRPVLDEAIGCAEEPQMSQALALGALLRSGRLDEARSHHLTGYRRVRGNTGMQAWVGRHLEFCVLSRNEGRGLEILAENRPLFEATGAPLAHLDFLTGVELLLARIVEDGHADTGVAGPPGRSWTADELLAHVRAQADPLTAAFDARNGTTAVGDRRRERLSQRPLLDAPLPLGLRTSVARPATAAAVPPTATAAVAIPEDFVTLVREARRMASVGHPGDTRLWTRIAERLADGSTVHDDVLGPLELLRAELAEQRAGELATADRDDEATVEMRQAGELYERLGMPWQALSTRALALAWTDPSAERDAEPAGDAERLDSNGIRDAFGELLNKAERLFTEVPFTGEALGAAEAAACDDLEQERKTAYLTVYYARTYAAYRELGRGGPKVSPGAVEHFEACVQALHTEAERLSVPHQVANARQFAADVAGRHGDLVRAEEGLRTALKDLEAADRPWRRSRPRALLAQILMAQERPQEAVELLHRTIADAVQYDDADFPMAPTYAMLGHAVSHLGDHASAVRHLSEAAARFDQSGASQEAAEVRLQLIDVLMQTGQQADAVAVLESLVAEEAAAALDERTVAQARLMLARGLRELEEFLPSAEEFLRLADAVSDWEDDAPIQTMVTAETAIALALADRWDAAGTAYERALAAHAQAPNPSLLMHMMCEFARLVMNAQGLEGLETALKHLVEADVLAASVPEGTEDFVPWFERGTVHYRRGRVLAEAERFEEALAETEAAVIAHEQGGKEGESARAEAVRIAALIEGNALRRFKEAIARLTAAAARCRKAGLPEAAQVLDALRQDYMSRLTESR
ncbi:tetratricopeptide repeat protein [Streptomyces sp. NPDC059499]|uniref:tetratricopeptide repeat protein n=1 Tax=Streptomyces sp. NPDC059499 TaxID=3346852 RepID=UPI0036CF3332